MLNFIIKIITINLIAMHNGTVIAKFKGAFFLSIVPALIGTFSFVSEWISENGGYIFFVSVAVAIDHVLGSAVHLFVKKDFSAKKNLSGIVVKIGLVLCIGVLFEGFQFIYKEDNFVSDYLTIISRLMVFLYPAGSAFMNSAILTKGAFPPVGWIQKVSKFNQSLNLDQFRKEEQNEELQ